jgi:hypothetical protein
MISNVNIWIGMCGKDIKSVLKCHTNVKLKNTNEDNSIEREERGMSITMHAVNINRKAARRDRAYVKPKQESIAVKRGRTSQYKQLV